uniref:Transporter n=1 Tax=Anabas testudineus TaxID=64144 RepID=A0A7N6BDI6_ANATE
LCMLNGNIMFGLAMNRKEKPENQQRAGDRGQWASKTEYVLVVAGNVVGLGNVWRFPYLCYKNGGGAFLLPYGLLALVCGIPLFLLEISVGQYTQEGFITCWKKISRNALYDFSYIVIQVWALFYLVFSFRSQLPWASCDNPWNTGIGSSRHLPTAATQSTLRRVLGMSAGIEELGSVRWDLALCLLVCWVFCYFSIWKSIKSSGKVAYFTATFPYVMLLILLIRGLTLPGAFEGIYFYLYPNLKGLANLEVWIEAGSQICFSYSVSSGTLIVLGSYNKYNNNCYRDCFWLCLLNSATSFVAGFVVFSVLGFMAQKLGVSVDNVAESGPGLAFIAYPQATAMMPLPQFWTVCFFLMLILLSVDTHFVVVECFITSVRDMFPKLFYKRGRHEIFVLLICVFFFLTHLILVTEVSKNISRKAHLKQTVAVKCFLNFTFFIGRNLHIPNMVGQRPFILFKLCWKYIIPLLSVISFILYLVDYTHLRFNNSYVYPDWAYVLGWTMTFSSLVMVPLWAAGQIVCLRSVVLKTQPG